MARAENTELIDAFEEFYRNYYRNEIGELAQKYPTEKRSLYVDWQDLYRFDPDLADDYSSHPEEFQEYAEEALRMYDLPVDVKLGQAHVRVRNLPETTEIRAIRADHRGTLISVQGIVRKATNVRPKIQQAAFECQRCGTLTRIPQTSGDFQEPHECQGCERQGPFRINFDQSEFVDAQKLRIQESPEGLRGGETPQSIDVHIEDDITGKVTAGDNVRVTGVLHLDQQGNNQEKSPVFDVYMDGVSVEIQDEQFEDMEITDADKKEIIELSNAPDIYERMVDSMAPSIYGYEEQKLAMILQLFSGVTKHLPDGSRIRGDLHMLLIGDPGTGKCVRPDTNVTLANGREVRIGDLVDDNLTDPTPVDDAPEVIKAVEQHLPVAGRDVEPGGPSHPLFVQSSCQFEPVRADELSEGDYVATPHKLTTTGTDTLDIDYRRSQSNNAVRLDLPAEWTPSLARFVGYVIGEGYVERRSDNTGYVSVTNDAREVLDDVVGVLDELGVNHFERGPSEGKTAREIISGSSELVSFLENLEPSILQPSADQCVPDDLMTATAEIKTAFIRAYLEAEAHVSATQREITVASMSHELLEDVRSILLGVGIRSQLSDRKGKSWRLRISGSQFQRYVAEIGFITDRKTTAVAAHEDVDGNTNLDIVPNVADELRKIRDRLGLAQSECGIPRTTYQHYERGDRHPGKASLQTVLDTFEQRIDWLLKKRDRVLNGRWEDIKTAREELNISQEAVAAGTELSQTAVSYYERNNAVPDGGIVSDATRIVLERIDRGLQSRSAVERLRAFSGGDVFWDTIEEIERIDPAYDWVYDLEVGGTHSYVSNNVISHNSQLLQYIRNIAPRSVYTSGKGSSSAGLTAAAVRDDFGDGQQWTLEAGALVLADQGIAAVDELDKMRPEDRSAMHEALEQQSYHPNSEVLLADGRRVEIGEFVDAKMAADPDAVVDGVDCEILPVDDAGVHSVDLETNEVTKRPIDRVSRHEAPEEFVRVTFSNGRDVLVTPDHPMFVAGGCDESDVGAAVETVPARDVEEGAFVPAPRRLPNSASPVEFADEPRVGDENDVDFPGELSPDLAEILGLLVAEGHAHAGSAHGIGFSNQDERLLVRMDGLMRDVFGTESTDTTDAAGTVTKRWVSTELYRWFEANVPEVMRTAREKRIPAAVLGASAEHIRRFLVGAFAGDGGVESEAVAFSTASEGLAADYADALGKIGVAARVHHDTTTDSWKTHVVGDSTRRFVEQVVDPADDRHAGARAFAGRSEETPRHHDVLPTAAARELRDLKRLLGVRLTGELRPHLDEGFGVRVGTVRDELRSLRDRTAAVSDALDDADTLAAVRSSVGWSGRELADRLDGETPSAVHYAEEGGYDAARRSRLTAAAKRAVRGALDEFERRADALEAQCDLRYYRVTDVETVPNEGEFACDWVYDVTVEPTNTFVSQGVVLHNSISVSKAGINATLKSRCSLLGAANPKYGRFDQYEPIGEQIDLEPALISRFDLIFTVTDQPDEEKDADLADHIIQTNYAGELHTHRQETATSNVSAEEVESVTEEVAPVIDAELLRKYVAYAKRTCFPTMTEEAKAAIRDFYVELRSKGQAEDAPVPVTARKLEALVRLSEASARVRLSDEVEAADAERVIDIVRSCLQDIGVDPETGELDADVVETGTSKSQRDRIKNLKALIADIEEEYDEGAPVDRVLERAEEVGMEATKAEHEIEKLKQKGEVYEPRTDHLRTT
ncbi:MCM family protein [Halobacteriales archaeon QS_1_68_17]|nr:MAG: MCM family protein [Halobacteriales archaeon QS_1_68_17]